MLTHEQFADLKTYIPESDTVKMVFAELHPEEDFDDWDEAVTTIVAKGLNGDKDSLFTLLELTYLSGHNEGLLEGTAP